ncbi:DUF4097 family beta strand repeat-containing protein [Streptomyces rectiviolaceus]|uniref:DUF4097 family beta strand repeat-containing protein n=1 Tax=Streptomyces rectiviolaceus TaxID=332591 RepID=UPI00363E19CC
MFHNEMRIIMKLRTLTAYSLTTAIGIALLTGCSPDDPASSKGSANMRDKKSSSATYEVRGAASQLSVDTTAGDVRIVASDRSSLKGPRRSRTRLTSRKHPTSRGGEVTLKDHDCRSGSCSVSYRIEVPERLASRISSGGGDITGSALAGSTAAKTNGGDVDLAFAKAPTDVDAFSAGGDVDVDLPAGRYAVQAQANGGDRKVGVKTDKSSVHKVTARSNGGDATVAQR